MQWTQISYTHSVFHTGWQLYTVDFWNSVFSFERLCVWHVHFKTSHILRKHMLCHNLKICKPSEKMKRTKTLDLSIRDRVQCKKNLALKKQFFQPFRTFSKKNYILCNFSMWLLKYFLKNFPPQNIKKLPSKVAHNPTRPPVFSPASFCIVKLRQI